MRVFSESISDGDFWNLSDGGESGRKMKLGYSRRNNFALLSDPSSEDAKDKISESHEASTVHRDSEITEGTLSRCPNTTYSSPIVEVLDQPDEDLRLRDDKITTNGESGHLLFDDNESTGGTSGEVIQLDGKIADFQQDSRCSSLNDEVTLSQKDLGVSHMDDSATDFHQLELGTQSSSPIEENENIESNVEYHLDMLVKSSFPTPELSTLSKSKHKADISSNIDRKQEKQNFQETETYLSKSLYDQMKTDSEFIHSLKSIPPQKVFKPKAEEAPDTRTLLKHFLLRGRRLLAANDGEMAVDSFVRAFAFARIFHGDQHWRTARCKLFMARTYLYCLSLPVQAINHSRESREAIMNTLNSSAIDVENKPQIHHTLAWSYLVDGEANIRLKKYHSAFRPLSNSLQHTEKFKELSQKRKNLSPSLRLDDPTELRLKIFNAQATLLESTGSFPKAKEKLEECFSLIKDVKSEKARHTHLCEALKIYGEFLLRIRPTRTKEERLLGQKWTNDRKEGFYALKRSLHLLQKINRPGSALECELRFLLVKHEVELSTERNLQPLRWELHKLNLWSTRIDGEFSYRTKAIRELFLEVLVKEGRIDEAIKQLENSLNVTKETFGVFNTEAVRIMRNLANMHLMKHNLTEALSCLEECLNAEQLLFGFSSRRVQSLKLKIKDVILQIPLDERRKFLRKHPDLQHRPPFRSFFR